MLEISKELYLLGFFILEKVNLSVEEVTIEKLYAFNKENTEFWKARLTTLNYSKKYILMDAKNWDTVVQNKHLKVIENLEHLSIATAFRYRMLRISKSVVNKCIKYGHFSGVMQEYFNIFNIKSVNSF